MSLGSALISDRRNRRKGSHYRQTELPNRLVQRTMNAVLAIRFKMQDTSELGSWSKSGVMGGQTGVSRQNCTMSAGVHAYKSPSEGTPRCVTLLYLLRAAIRVCGKNSVRTSKYVQLFCRSIFRFSPVVLCEIFPRDTERSPHTAPFRESCSFL